MLWELSIVSSLSWYSIPVQHACNDRAWLTSECSPGYARPTDPPSQEGGRWEKTFYGDGLRGGIKSSFQRLPPFFCWRCCSITVAPKKALFHVISLLGDLMIIYISTDIARLLSCFVKEITTIMRCVRIFLSRSRTVSPLVMYCSTKADKGAGVTRWRVKCQKH